MDDSLMPGWMKEKLAAKKLEAAQAEAELQKGRADNLIADREGPLFWNRLKEKLSIDIAFLTKFNMSGTVESLPDEPRPAMRVSVRNSSPRDCGANETYTDLLLDLSGIICRPEQRTEYSFGFRVGHDSKLVAIGPNAQSQSPDNVAEFIMRQMFDAVEDRYGQ